MVQKNQEFSQSLLWILIITALRAMWSAFHLNLKISIKYLHCAVESSVFINIIFHKSHYFPLNALKMHEEDDRTRMGRHCSDFIGVPVFSLTNSLFCAYTTVTVFSGNLIQSSSTTVAVVSNKSSWLSWNLLYLRAHFHLDFE